ncbi:hypothetical protein ACIA8I_30685 [Streptomyces rishiriensis]|uniref:hypothetical protein n=1 Tax=Streptomyces rishiriensis TaxID=68264 RepID=UPI0037A81A99
MKSHPQGPLYGLRAEGRHELFVAGSSGVGCVALLISSITGGVSPWWSLVAVPVGAFNAIEVIGYFAARRGR